MSEQMKPQREVRKHLQIERRVTEVTQESRVVGREIVAVTSDTIPYLAGRVRSSLGIVLAELGPVIFSRDTSTLSDVIGISTSAVGTGIAARLGFRTDSMAAERVNRRKLAEERRKAFLARERMEAGQETVIQRPTVQPIDQAKAVIYPPQEISTWTDWLTPSGFREQRAKHNKAKTDKLLQESDQQDWLLYAPETKPAPAAATPAVLNEDEFSYSGDVALNQEGRVIPHINKVLLAAPSVSATASGYAIWTSDLPVLGKLGLFGVTFIGNLFLGWQAGKRYDKERIKELERNSAYDFDRHRQLQRLDDKYKKK